MSSILVERHGAVAELVLNNPDQMNLLSRGAYGELREGYRAAMSDPQVRVVLLRAEGDHFCAGFDLGASADGAAAPIWSQLEQVEETFGLEDEIRYGRKPTVCAIQGHCLGGGFELANSCDFIVAADDAKFSLPEVRFSLVAPPRLMYFTTMRKAKEILLLGDVFTAQEAESLGLTNRTCARADLPEAAMAFAERVAALPPETVRHTRMLITRATDAMGMRVVESMAASEFILSKQVETEDRTRFAEIREAEGTRAALAWVRAKHEGGPTR